jgi:hypothetical protein
MTKEFERGFNWAKNFLASGGTVREITEKIDTEKAFGHYSDFDRGADSFLKQV